VKSHRIAKLFLAFVAMSISVYGGIRPGAAQTAGTPEALRSFPADCNFVFGADVKRIVASPLYRQVAGGKADAIKARYQSVFDEIGLDPERDIDHVYGATRPAGDGAGGADVKEESILLVSGSFNQKAATDVILRRPRVTEKNRGRHRIFTVAEGQGADALKKSIVFLSEREALVGDPAAVDGFLDAREGGKPGLLADPRMASLLQSVDFGGMVWFAGDAASAIRSSPVKSPLEQQGLNAAAYIRSVAGAMDFAEAFSGSVTAFAVDAGAAEQLTGSFRVLMDIVRAGSGDKPQAKMFLDGFSMSRQDERILIRLDYPAGFFEQLMKLGPPK